LTNKEIAILVYSRIFKELPGNINENKIIAKITNSDVLLKADGNLNLIEKAIKKCLQEKKYIGEYFGIEIQFERHTSFKVGKRFLNTTVQRLRLEFPHADKID